MREVYDSSLFRNVPYLKHRRISEALKGQFICELAFFEFLSKKVTRDVKTDIM